MTERNAYVIKPILRTEHLSASSRIPLKQTRMSNDRDDPLSWLVFLVYLLRFSSWLSKEVDKQNLSLRDVRY